MKKLWKDGTFDHVIKRGEDSPMFGKKKSKETKLNLSNSIKQRLKAVCCIKCHKPKEDASIHDGVWKCHYVTHHSNCE